MHAHRDVYDLSVLKVLIFFLTQEACVEIEAIAVDGEPLIPGKSVAKL